MDKSTSTNSALKKCELAPAKRIVVASATTTSSRDAVGAALGLVGKGKLTTIVTVKKNDGFVPHPCTLQQLHHTSDSLVQILHDRRKVSTPRTETSGLFRHK